MSLIEAFTDLSEHTPLTMRDAVLAYAAAQLPVFPCAPGRKTPLTHNGFWEATTDPQQIRRWWSWQPDANIGLATGRGVDVLDIDVHGAGDGVRRL